MMRIKFGGVVCPMITPFTKNGELYEEGVKNVATFLKENGVRGLFICGIYGLGPAMTIKQRKRVAELTVEQVGGSRDVIIQVGSTTIETTIELAKHAEDVGADAVASTPPFYFKYDPKAPFGALTEEEIAKLKNKLTELGFL